MTAPTTSASTPAAAAVRGDDRHPLDAIFHPTSIAVIGATEKPGSVGRTILWNLLSSPFGGTVYPVNPTRPAILGVKAYPSVAAIGEPVDLAVIVTPAKTAPQLVGGVRRGRDQGRDHHQRRVQGGRRRGRGARAAGARGRAPVRHPRRRPELPRRHEPDRAD